MPEVVPLSLKEVASKGLAATPSTLTTPQLAEEEKFFLTEGKIRRNSGEGLDFTDSAGPEQHPHKLSKFSSCGAAPLVALLVKVGPTC